MSEDIVLHQIPDESIRKYVRQRLEEDENDNVLVTTEVNGEHVFILAAVLDLVRLVDTVGIAMFFLKEDLLKLRSAIDSTLVQLGRVEPQ